MPEPPIFYPVLTFAYAERIARDWNSADPRHGNLGFVTEFDVAETFLTGYETRVVGGRECVEYWIPAEDLPRFNDEIVGEIRVVAEYRDGARVDTN